MRKFQIIGAGMGVSDILTVQALEAVKNGGVVLSTARLAHHLSALGKDIKIRSTAQLGEEAIKHNGSIVILVSGDPGFFSAAKKLSAFLEPYGEVEVLCGISSLQYFCAKCKTSYDDAALLSLHGRDGSILGPVSYNRKVFALTGGKYRTPELCQQLCAAGLGQLRVSIGENLGSEKEFIFTGTAKEAAKRQMSDLAVMLIENEAPANAFAPLRDCDFVRGEVPMTKEEVRWLAAAKMRVFPEAVVWDIGAGTGSCSMEFARLAHRGLVYAVEKSSEALKLIAQNRVKTGNYHVQIVPGSAPAALFDLPKPDCAFLGGSGGKMQEILTCLLEKNPSVRVVISAIAVETLGEAAKELETLGFLNMEIVQLHTAWAKKAGPYHMMMGQNPVYLISADGPGGQKA